MRTLSILFLLIPFGLSAQILNLPARPAGALTGDQFASLVTSMSLTDRENEIYAQVMSGNVPAFQRNLIAVTNSQTISSTLYTYTYYVLPDYLAIGCDSNYFLCPMTPLLAQRIADATGCTLPTRKMVNQIWTAATLHLAPRTIPPSAQMTTIPVMLRHSDTVWQQRYPVLSTHPLGELVGGDKKDVVISNIIYGYPAPGRVVIYGWHYTSGTAIQPLYNGHEDTYADYSHGIRLVQMNMLVNGVSTTVSSVLQSASLNSLLSDEGTIAVPRYPVSLPSLTVPTSFAIVNENSSSLRLIASPQIDITHFLIQRGSDGISFPIVQRLHKDSLLLTGLTPDQPVYIKIAAVSNYDTSAYSEVLGAVPSLCEASVLIVNGFDRASAGNTYNFIRQHGGAFFSNTYSFVSCTNEALVNGLVVADSFRLVDYILGNESTVNESFSTAEQTIISNYLMRGGMLLVSGAEIGWDLDHMGSTVDQSFYHNFLKAAYVNDAPNGQTGVYYQVQPSASSVFSGIPVFSFDNGTHGTFNVNYPDVISAQGGATNCFEYSGLTANYAGICFSGVFPGGSSPGKLLNLGFPFETVYPETTRNLLMQSFLNYFDLTPSGLEKPLVSIHNDTLFSDWNGTQQWYCNGSAVPGANSNFLIPEINGDYSVVAERSGCFSDSSDQIVVTFTNISENLANMDVRVFPNPCSDWLNINIEGQNTEALKLSILDMTDQTLYEQQLFSSIVLPTNGFPPGIYILRIEGKYVNFNEKIVVY